MPERADAPRPAAVPGGEPAVAGEALSGRACVERLLATRPPEFDVREVAPSGLPDWQRQLRERLWQLLGGPPAEPVRPDLQLGDAEQCDGFTLRHVTFATEPGVRTAAYLLTPDAGRRRPGGVLALHGHGGGKELVVGRGDPETVRSHGYDYGAELARRGHLVLAPDARGFGERGGGSERGCHVYGLTSLLLGQPPAGQRLRDDMAALSLLRALAGTPRVAVVGLSEGGKRAAYLAAMDERVHVAAISGYFTTLRAEVQQWDRLWGWDICNCVPGLLSVADYPDLLALCAPRWLWVEVAVDDPLYSPEAAAAGAAVVAEVYRARGVPERFRYHTFAGGHRFSGEPCLDWLGEALEG